MTVFAAWIGFIPARGFRVRFHLVSVAASYEEASDRLTEAQADLVKVGARVTERGLKRIEVDA